MKIQLKNDLLVAAKSHFVSNRDTAMSNLGVYLTNPVGVGEHGDVVEVVTDLVGQITEANDNIKTVENILGVSDPQVLTESDNLKSSSLGYYGDSHGSGTEFVSSYDADKIGLFNEERKTHPGKTS